MGLCLAKPPKGKEEPRADMFPLKVSESRICDYYVDNLPARLQGDGLHLLRGGPGPIVLGWTHELLDASGVHSFQDRELLLNTRDKIVAAVELHRERRSQQLGSAPSGVSSCISGCNGRALKRGSLDGAASPSGGSAAAAGAGAASGNSASAAACASGGSCSDGTLTAAADTAALYVDAAAHAAEAAAANTASLLDSNGRPFHLTSDWLSADVPLYRISEERSLRRNVVSGIPDPGAGRILMQTVEPVPELPCCGADGGGDGDDPAQVEAELVVVVEGDGDGAAAAAACSPRAAARVANLAKMRPGREVEEEGGVGGDPRDDDGGQATERDSDRGRDTFSPGLAPAVAETEVKAFGDVGEAAGGDTAGRVVSPPDFRAKPGGDGAATISSFAVPTAGKVEGDDEGGDCEGPHRREIADGTPLPAAVCIPRAIAAVARVGGAAGGAAAPIPPASCASVGAYDGGVRQGLCSGSCTATGGEDSSGSCDSLGADSLAALTSLATPISPPVASATIAKSQAQHRHQGSNSCASSEVDTQPPQPQERAATSDDGLPQEAAGLPEAPTAQVAAHA